MKFEDAMGELKAGGKIGRSGVSGVAYIELVTGEYPYLRGVSTVALGSVELPILFTANDVLADNWEVVPSDVVVAVNTRTELMDSIRSAYAVLRDYQSQNDLMNAARWHDYYLQLSAMSYLEDVPAKDQWPEAPQ
ncbi:DUF2829 domain-containing protein [Aeromonas sp. sia0103]|uniref:DUF2829 domain-containing protein n=1 Tax=Aeromonas sp. sia0103 TaxID=2854782 RepID=UPI001C48E870|nr:DUF2829 domain-containing protein [Aeromonas sp. sia0103]MBV7598039.1 DUF2829 domain-containing protein [Aeromonas sp. sia0103]